MYTVYLNNLLFITLKVLLFQHMVRLGQDIFQFSQIEEWASKKNPV